MAERSAGTRKIYHRSKRGGADCERWRQHWSEERKRTEASNAVSTLERFNSSSQLADENSNERKGTHAFVPGRTMLDHRRQSSRAQDTKTALVLRENCFGTSARRDLDYGLCKCPLEKRHRRAQEHLLALGKIGAGRRKMVDQGTDT